MNTALKDYADSESLKNQTRGGYDNKYQKLRGIGEYMPSNSRNLPGKGNMGSDSKMSDNWNGGGRVRDFANLTGIRTNKSRAIDCRLWKNYRQFAGTEDDGNKSSDGKSEPGEYP